MPPKIFYVARFVALKSNAKTNIQTLSLFLYYCIFILILCQFEFHIK